MKAAKLLSLVAVLGLFVSTTQASVPIVVNEFWADDDLGDTNEFIELFGPGGTDLTGLSVIIIDNDNGGNLGSSTYRRVNELWVLDGFSIPADGFFVLGAGPDVAGVTDFPIAVGNLENGSQTYALVDTADLAFCVSGAGCLSGALDANGEHIDTDELSPGSIAAIAAGAHDLVATWNEDVFDLFDFPIQAQFDFGVDTASRFPNGVDTNRTQADWVIQDNFSLAAELGGPTDALSTPGRSNIPEPATALLLSLGSFAILRRRR